MHDIKYSSLKNHLSEAADAANVCYWASDDGYRAHHRAALIREMEKAVELYKSIVKNEQAEPAIAAE